jgi:hypothetical protein
LAAARELAAARGSQTQRDVLPSVHLDLLTQPENPAKAAENLLSIAITFINSLLQQDAVAAPSQSKELLRDAAVKKAKFLLSKHRLQERDVYDFVREFFRDYLSLKYEFTFDELQTELGKVYMDAALKAKLKDYIRSIAHIEYVDSAIPHDTLAAQINTFVDLIKLLVPHHHTLHHPWHRRLHRWITGKGVVEQVGELSMEAPKTESLYPAEEAALNQLERDQDTKRAEGVAAETSKMELLLNTVAQHLARRELEEARAAYAELAAYYESLPEGEKSVYFDQVQALFDELSHPGHKSPLPESIRTKDQEPAKPIMLDVEPAPQKSDNKKVSWDEYAEQ